MHDGIWVTILGLFGLVTIAVLALPLSKVYRMPYTVLLAVVGILLGLITAEMHDTQIGAISDLFHSFESFELTSEIIIFVFLPALIFESSLAIDVRKLMADIKPILFLAVVGLLISSFLVGGAVYAVSGMGFIACLLLGAILSATDPVAVVAIFKDLGAPKRLAILVEGESLFNDATAIVLFNILVAMIIGSATADLFGGTLSFIKVFVGGIFVGYLMARIFAWVISKIASNAIIEVTLTISLAYLSFLVAEHYLHVSGVMAVVAAALVMGSHGRTSISGNGWHLLKETWENVGFWANSLIFVLVGLAVPQILSVFSNEMWVTLLVLIVVAFFARGLLTHVVLPLLTKAGAADPVSLGFRTVMWWGGLRGAVSLALAVAVFENDAFPEDVRNFVAALVCAFVVFTLIVNATTVGWVMKSFGLDQLSDADQAIRYRAVSKALGDIAATVPVVANQHTIPEGVAKAVSNDYKDRVESMRSSDSQQGALDGEDWLKVGLIAIIGQEREGYLNEYVRGYAEPSIARQLIATTDELMDGVKAGGPLGYSEAWVHSLRFNRRFHFSMQLQRRFSIVAPLSNRLSERMEFLRTALAVLSTVRNEGVPDFRALAGQNPADALSELLDSRIEKIQSALDALHAQYPDYAAKLQSRYLRQVALRQERAEYERLHEAAIIGTEVYANLEKEISERESELRKRPTLDLGLNPEYLVSKVPLFEGLSQKKIKSIANLLKPNLAIPGEVICREGEVGNSMYFVSSGAVAVQLSTESVMLGSGDFFGEIALVKDTKRTADVVAESFSDLLTLDRSDFEKLLNTSPDLRRTIEEVAESRMPT